MKKQFDKWAETIHRLAPSIEVSVKSKAEILQACGVAGPGKSLDLGCAIGVWAAAAQQLGYEAAGIDFSNKMLLRAAELFPDLRLLHGDAGALEPTGEFDLITAMGNHVTYHEDLEAFVSGIAGALKPGGLALVALEPCSFSAARPDVLRPLRLVRHPGKSDTLIVERRARILNELMEVTFAMICSDRQPVQVRYEAWNRTFAEVSTAAAGAGLEFERRVEGIYIPTLVFRKAV